MSSCLDQMFRTSCFAFFHNVILEISATLSNFLRFKKYSTTQQAITPSLKTRLVCNVISLDQKRTFNVQFTYTMCTFLLPVLEICNYEYFPVIF